MRAAANWRRAARAAVWEVVDVVRCAVWTPLVVLVDDVRCVVSVAAGRARGGASA